MDDEALIERETARKRIYSGKILDLDVAAVALPSGKEAAREIVVHKGAAAVLPVNEKAEAALVRQYRASIGKITLEIPAGKLDRPGEPPMDCAIRELREETGLRAETIRQIARIYTTPGFSNEQITIYLATGLSQDEAAPDDDEFVNVVWMPLEELYQTALEGGIEDSKTLIALLLAKELLS